MNSYHYHQLAGALGMLKSHGVDLPYAAINEEMRYIAAKYGPDACDIDRIIEMHRQYRRRCLDLRLIQCGEIFNLSDCVSLV